jgi:hypothetical protein
MLHHDLNALADTYLRNHTTRRDEDFWAYEGINWIIGSGDLDNDWNINPLLMRRANTDEEQPLSPFCPHRQRHSRVV